MPNSFGNISPFYTVSDQEAIGDAPASSFEGKVLDMPAIATAPALEIESAPAISRTVRFSKDAGRALDDAKSEAQLHAIMSAVTAGQKARGWTVGFEDGRATFRQLPNRSGGYVYTVDVAVACKPSKLRSTLGQEFENIVAMMHAKAMQPANRWRVSHIDGEPYVAKEVERIEVDSSEEIGYAPLNMPEDAEWEAAFDHLYGLDDYTLMIRRQIEAAEMSGWQQRVNIALVGPPACGKSDICKSLKKVLGEEAVLEFDGTSTTQAGAQQELAEREELPRILLVEEIEKAPEASLQWLLSVLDLRGEVRKTTARGNILREVHMVGICTVNDWELFQNMKSGALASRFAMPLFFRRPSREILWKILDREVRKMGGNTAWIEPTLDFADEMHVTDPRKLIAWCLTGREMLLTGEYQKMLRRTMPPEHFDGTAH